jgi:hypothetical protein
MKETVCSVISYTGIEQEVIYQCLQISSEAFSCEEKLNIVDTDNIRRCATHTILSRIVLSGILLRSNIPVTNGENTTPDALRPTEDKICEQCFNGLPEKKEPNKKATIKYGGKKPDSMYRPLALWNFGL